jgi:hypothetical protein
MQYPLALGRGGRGRGSYSGGEVLISGQWVRSISNPVKKEPVPEMFHKRNKLHLISISELVNVA